ncbi:hypothetical protein ARMGADRAFT_1030399 [Armillaria gallica]|uniref:Protein kinase domain-containing protein n=1 Tax=Armillaria gallica TaxID=47427 RepID=A0A2H3DGI1_ARMGA|nr:hypothetical protein ARMGADRAFT_1030399 [Armillaria gallica]
MSRYLDIDSCIQAARLTAAAGEMAPFPFIKGAALCVVVTLENIQRAGQNKSDLQELAERIVNTLVAVRDTVIEHGPTSALHFQKVCVEFQEYLTDLQLKLNNEDMSPRGIWRFFKAKKISNNIGAFQQQVQAVKEDFLIRTTTTTQLVLSDIQDQVTTKFSALTGAMEMSERNVTSTIKDNIEDIRTLGNQHNKNMEKLQMTLLQVLQQQGTYKGTIRNLIPGDIYLEEPISCYQQDENSAFDGYYAYVNDQPKIVHVYRVQANNKEQMMQKFKNEVDRRLYLRHPNITQLFGVCMSSTFPALIFHDNHHNQPLYNFHGFVKNILLTQPYKLRMIKVLHYIVKTYRDLKSIANYLNQQDWIQQLEEVEHVLEIYKNTISGISIAIFICYWDFTVNSIILIILEGVLTIQDMLVMEEWSLI